MGRNPGFLIALILACLLLVGCAALESAPHQDQVPVPPHTVHTPTQSR